MSEDIAALVGRRIMVTRVGCDCSQKELADRLGVTQTAVSYWESGQRMMNTDQLLAIAEALDVAPAVLLPDEPLRDIVPTEVHEAVDTLLAAAAAEEGYGKRMYVMLSGCYPSATPRTRPIDYPFSDPALIRIWPDGRVESLIDIDRESL